MFRSLSHSLEIRSFYFSHTMSNILVITLSFYVLKTKQGRKGGVGMKAKIVTNGEIRNKAYFVLFYA